MTNKSLKTDEFHVKKWLRRLFNVVLYLTIALACVLVLISVLSQRDQPLWGLNTYIVTSGSMEPEIKTGSLILARNSQASDVEVGDVITYKLGDELIAHRLIEKRADGFLVTKGDANEITDAPMLPQDVSGKVVFTIPYLGMLTNFVHSLAGFIVLIVLPALLLLGMFLWDIWIGNDKKKRATTVVAPLLVVGLILCGLHTSVAQAYYSAESESVGFSLYTQEEPTVLLQGEEGDLPLVLGVGGDPGDDEGTATTTTVVSSTTTSTSAPAEEGGEATEGPGGEEPTTTTTAGAATTTTTTTIGTVGTTTTTTAGAVATTTTTEAAAQEE